MIRRGLALTALLAPALPVQAGGDLPWGIDQPQVVAALLRQPVPAEDGFGRGFNHTGLTILWRDCAACETVSVQHDLPPGRSFADTMARKVDLDGDGTREVLLVEQEASGAAVSVSTDDAAGDAAGDASGSSSPSRITWRATPRCC